MDRYFLYNVSFSPFSPSAVISCMTRFKARIGRGKSADGARKERIKPGKERAYVHKYENFERISISPPFTYPLYCYLVFPLSRWCSCQKLDNFKRQFWCRKWNSEFYSRSHARKASTLDQPDTVRTYYDSSVLAGRNPSLCDEAMTNFVAIIRNSWLSLHRIKWISLYFSLFFLRELLALLHTHEPYTNCDCARMQFWNFFTIELFAWSE